MVDDGSGLLESPKTVTTARKPSYNDENRLKRQISMDEIAV
jgi:hypothetical protein